MGYWTDVQGNVYGPFSVQEDGFPNAGEVIRYYREVGGMTRQRLAEHLQVNKRWVTKMENENKVPELISRRRTIATLLKIPPTLLGLAVLEEVLQPLEASQGIITSQTRRVFIDEAVYKEDLRMCWGLHFTSAAHPSFQAIELKTLQIEALAPDISGSQRNRLLGIASGYRRFLSRVARDQQDFSTALTHVNRSIELAEYIESQELKAGAFLTRGRMWFEQRRFDLAVQDLEKALSYVDGWGTQLEGTILLELALALSHTDQTPGGKAAVLRLTDRAESIVRGAIEDDGSFTKLSPGVYHMHRAEISIALNRIDAPDLLEYATGEISPDQTRRLAYVDILQAALCLRDKEILAASSVLEQALDTSLAVGSRYNISRIQELYIQLSRINSGSTTVKTLGRKLERAKK